MTRRRANSYGTEGRQHEVPGAKGTGIREGHQAALRVCGTWRNCATFPSPRSNGSRKSSGYKEVHKIAIFVQMKPLIVKNINL